MNAIYECTSPLPLELCQEIFSYAIDTYEIFKYRLEKCISDNVRTHTTQIGVSILYMNVKQFEDEFDLTPKDIINFINRYSTWTRVYVYLVSSPKDTGISGGHNSVFYNNYDGFYIPCPIDDLPKL